MNVLIVVDKYGSAIWRLAEAVRTTNPHLNIKVFPVHPKRNSPEDLFQAQDLLKWCDILDVHYWKSGEVLKSSFGPEFAQKKKILFHFNPYDIDKQDWNQTYDRVVVGNQEMFEKIPYSTLVPYSIDLDFFEYKEEYTEEKVVHMSVNRIESKKGVAQVAQACHELGYKLLLIGRVSEPEYVKDFLHRYGPSVDFRESVDEDKLRDSYYESALHVCNSADNFESGTLPILEAMACGTPVLTRNIGHVPDLFDGANMQVREGGKDDVEDLKKNLKELMENRPLRMKMREKAWETVKNRDIRRMGRIVSNMYYQLWLDSRPLVSVIVPTYDRPESLVSNLVSITHQDYKKIEIVIADSGKTPVKLIADKVAEQCPMPVKYIRFQDEGYTLAQARNRAVIEAQGQVLVFVDDRLSLEEDAVSKFAEKQHDKMWQWGQKDGSVKGFVENFSCIKRADLIKHGMFLERMQWYGGMSQEIRTRFEDKNSFVFELNSDAKARSNSRTRSKASRRKQIIEAKLLLHKMNS